MLLHLPTIMVVATMAMAGDLGFKCGEKEFAETQGKYQLCAAEKIDKIAKYLEGGNFSLDIFCTAVRDLIHKCGDELGWCFTEEQVAETKKKQRVGLESVLGHHINSTSSPHPLQVASSTSLSSEEIKRKEEMGLQMMLGHQIDSHSLETCLADSSTSSSYPPSTTQQSQVKVTKTTTITSSAVLPKLSSEHSQVAEETKRQPRVGQSSGRGFQGSNSLSSLLRPHLLILLLPFLVACCRQ